MALHVIQRGNNRGLCFFLAEKIEHRLLAYDELLDTPLDVKLVEEIRKATRGLRRG